MTDTPSPTPPPDPAAGDPAGVQQQLNAACHDLDRLQALLAGTCGDLAERFHDVVALVDALDHSAGAQDATLRSIVAEARRMITGAVMALQFEDMATQLIGHTQERLRHCREQLAGAAGAMAPAESTPPQANPVSQSEMLPGSVELF